MNLKFSYSNHDSGRTRFLLGAGHVFAGLVIAALLALIFGWVVMLLWNGVLPSLLGLRTIDYWQSVGLILLTRILVGGLPQSRGHQAGQRHNMRAHAWRDYDEWWKEAGEKSFQDYTRDDKHRE